MCWPKNYNLSFTSHDAQINRQCFFIRGIDTARRNVCDLALRSGFFGLYSYGFLEPKSYSRQEASLLRRRADQVPRSRGRPRGHLFHRARWSSVFVLVAAFVRCFLKRIHTALMMTIYFLQPPQRDNLAWFWTQVLRNSHCCVRSAQKQGANWKLLVNKC